MKNRLTVRRGAQSSDLRVHGGGLGIIAGAAMGVLTTLMKDEGRGI